MPLSSDYRNFVLQHPQAEVWHQPDLLTASDPEGWNDVVVHAGKEVVGVLPYFLKQSTLGKVLTMPPLIRYAGPLFKAGSSVGEQEQLLPKLLAKLAAQGVKIDQHWSPQASKLVVAAGFRSKERTTYIAPLSGNAEAVLARCNKATRRKLRRAGERFSAQFESFQAADLALLKLPFARQGMQAPYSDTYLLNLIKALQDLGSIKTVKVYNAAAQVVAVSIALLDKAGYYLWIEGAHQHDAAKNAGIYSEYLHLLEAQRLGYREVDFLGSMIPSIANVRKQLGGQPVPYKHIYKDNALWAKALRWYRG